MREEVRPDPMLLGNRPPCLFFCSGCVVKTTASLPVLAEECRVWGMVPQDESGIGLELLKGRQETVSSQPKPAFVSVVGQLQYRWR